ncbi:hypothetical protein RDABS01_000850 [Bienertia sinuspersici]
MLPTFLCNLATLS